MGGSFNVTPTKLLIGQILVVFAIVIAGLWAATQWAAAMLAYQPELGPAWFMAGSTPVYRPWALFPWWYHYDAYAPHVFDKAGALAGARGFIGCGAANAGSLWRARQPRRGTTHGSARLAVICAITAPNISWRSRRPVRARASGWSFRRCSAGPAAPSFTTSRVKTGS